mgnify:CR=1 FL=1
MCAQIIDECQIVWMICLFVFFCLFDFDFDFWYKHSIISLKSNVCFALFFLFWFFYAYVWIWWWRNFMNLRTTKKIQDKIYVLFPVLLLLDGCSISCCLPYSLTYVCVPENFLPIFIHKWHIVIQKKIKRKKILMDL